MSTESLFCPRCGTEGAGNIRFCRQCGTNLESVGQMLSRTPEQTQPAKPIEAEDLLKQFKRDTFWLAVRGIVTVVIAFPFALLTLQPGGVISLLLAIVLLTFVGLGIRDLAKAAASLRDPVSALAKLKAQREGQREVTSASSIESHLEGEARIACATNALPSVTEHTTYELKEPDGRSSTSKDL